MTVLFLFKLVHKTHKTCLREFLLPAFLMSLNLVSASKSWPKFQLMHKKFFSTKKLSMLQCTLAGNFSTRLRSRYTDGIQILDESGIQIVHSIVHRVLHGFLVSNWHANSKFITGYTCLSSFVKFKNWSRSKNHQKRFFSFVTSLVNLVTFRPSGWFELG